MSWRAPALAPAHPTHEHFLLLFAVGAADGWRRVEYAVGGFEYWSLSRLTLAPT